MDAKSLEKIRQTISTGFQTATDTGMYKLVFIGSQRNKGKAVRSKTYTHLF